LNTTFSDTVYVVTQKLTYVYASGYSNSSDIDFEDIKNDRLFPCLEGETSGCENCVF